MLLCRQDLSVSLLEFNSGPDLKMTGERLDYVIQHMTAGMVDIAINGTTFPVLRTTTDTGIDIAPLEEDGITRQDALTGRAWLDRSAHRLEWDLVYDKAWPMAQGSGPTMAFQ